jgi:hypothetical protein
MTGVLDCWALMAAGHATAPPTSARNFRRLTVIAYAMVGRLRYQLPCTAVRKMLLCNDC